MDLPDLQSDPSGYRAALTERIDTLLGPCVFKLQQKVQLLLLSLGE